jgi:hypothetical protein
MNNTTMADVDAISTSRIKAESAGVARPHGDFANAWPLDEPAGMDVSMVAIGRTGRARSDINLADFGHVQCSVAGNDAPSAIGV